MSKPGDNNTESENFGPHKDEKFILKKQVI